MSEDFEPLEHELRRLRPRALSLETEMRVEERLRAARRSTALGRLAAAIFLGIGIVGVCTCFAVVLILRQGFDQETVIAGEPRPEQNVAVEKSIPTLAAYRQAFATSPEAFEALLDRPTAGSRPETPLFWGQSFRNHMESPF